MQALSQLSYSPVNGADTNIFLLSFDERKCQRAAVDIDGKGSGLIFHSRRENVDDGRHAAFYGPAKVSVRGAGPERHRRGIDGLRRIVSSHQRDRQTPTLGISAQLASRKG